MIVFAFAGDSTTTSAEPGLTFFGLRGGSSSGSAGAGAFFDPFATFAGFAAFAGVAGFVGFGLRASGFGLRADAGSGFAGFFSGGAFADALGAAFAFALAAGFDFGFDGLRRFLSSLLT